MRNMTLIELKKTYIGLDHIISLLSYNYCICYCFQVGSFNFDNRKMVFENYLMPFMPNHTKSILDYDVKIENLRPEATFFVPAETGNFSDISFL